MPTDPAAQFQAVDIRHQQIRNDQTESSFPEGFPCVLTVFRDDDLVAQFLQQPAQQFSGILIIFGN